MQDIVDFCIRRRVQSDIQISLEVVDSRKIRVEDGKCNWVGHGRRTRCAPVTVARADKEVAFKVVDNFVGTADIVISLLTPVISLIRYIKSMMHIMASSVKKIPAT
jgi:hypothetical protein